MRKLGKKGFFDDIIDNLGALLLLLLTFIILVLTVRADRLNDDFTYRASSGMLSENQQFIQLLRTETDSGATVADLFANKSDNMQQAFLKQIVTTHFNTLHPKESWALIMTYPDNTIITIKSDDHRKKFEIGQLYLPTVDGKAVKVTIMIDQHRDTMIAVLLQTMFIRP